MQSLLTLTCQRSRTKWDLNAMQNKRDSSRLSPFLGKIQVRSADSLPSIEIRS